MMWEVKYATQSGSIDFMWYGRGVSRKEAERRFRSLSEIGLEPISLREIQQFPTGQEYQAMRFEANEAPGRYQVIVIPPE